MYLYIIDCNEFTKIGHASDMLARIKGLQTGNPYSLTIAKVFYYKNAWCVEMALHQAFEHTRVRGEWFSLSKEEREKLFSMCLMLGGEIISISIDSVLEKCQDEEETEDDIEEIVIPPAIMREREKKDDVIRKLAKSIQDKWYPTMSKSAVARLLNERYAGSWAYKIDRIIDILKEAQTENVYPD